MAATTFAINKILDAVFNGGTLGAPTNFYVGFSTTLMDKESTADSISEPTDTSYERQEITDWTTALDGEVSNSGSIVFTETSEEWGNVYSVFLASGSVTGEGDIWYFHNLDPLIPVISDTVITFESNTLKARIV